MELSTGTVLAEDHAHDKLPIASVTKIMTLLLTMEAIDCEVISVDDIVTCSTYASSMGGSQIWLKEGEQMSVREMLKCIVVSSANDAAVAMAEHLCGSEEAFVSRMNERAAELANNVTYGFWERPDGEHTVVRFATSWATKQSDVDYLASIL